MSNITAKIKLNSKSESSDGQVQLNFGADYADERNKEWAKYTPGLSLTMTVLDEVADKFEQGAAYTLTFSENREPANADVLDPELSRVAHEAANPPPA